MTERIGRGKESHTILQDEKTGLFYRKGTYDKEVIKECFGEEYNFDILSQEDILFDIGGNIGAFSKRASPLVKQIICFEPEPENFALCAKNLEGTTNVLLENFALVANNDKERSFFLNKGMNKGLHSLHVKKRRAEITVKCKNFREAVKEHRPTAIKMDIEGGEYELLDGFIFPDFVKKFSIEFHLCPKIAKLKYKNVLENILSQNFVASNGIEPTFDTRKNWIMTFNLKR